MWPLYIVTIFLLQCLLQNFQGLLQNWKISSDHMGIRKYSFAKKGLVGRSHLEFAHDYYYYIDKKKDIPQNHEKVKEISI